MIVAGFRNRISGPMVFVCLLTSWTSAARAEVQLSGVFADHMVLQRDAKVPVWGTADAGEVITVTFGEQKVSTTADANGKWRVKLVDLQAGGPYTLTITGKNRIELSDVLVGEVWLCSGQSNMAYSMGSLKNTEYASDLASADLPWLRQGSVPRKPSVEPRETTDVKWTVCSPQTVSDITAAGFYFARELHQDLNVPIGLLHSSWGGTSAESWTSIQALDTVATFKTRAQQQLANLAQLPEQIQAFPAAIAGWEQKSGRADPGNTGEKQGWADPAADTTTWKPIKFNAKWRDIGLPHGGIAWLRKEIDIPTSAAGKEFRLDLGPVEEQYSAAWFNGEKLGESGRKAPEFYGGYVGYKVPGRLVKGGRNVLALRFVAPVGDKAGTIRKPESLGFATLGVTNLDDNCLMKIEAEFPPLSKEALAARPPCPRGDAAHTSSALYGGMIHPLIPFAIRGCAWYQGEQDASRAFAYRTLLPLLIRDWRMHWGQGDFPFVIQQLPNWVADGAENTTWAEQREAQALTARNVLHCGLSVAIDIGESKDVHPKNKRDIGRRLALVALANVYGRTVAASGPVYESMTVEGSAIRVKFQHADGLTTTDGQPPRRFTIAGEDRKFVAAATKIDGSTVIVSSPQVPRPAAVRYAFVNDPVGVNLANASGLPAAPFRTDTWPGSTDKRN